MENTFGRPVEVEVRDSLEKAMKILKQKMSKEGILQELKRGGQVFFVHHRVKDIEKVAERLRALVPEAHVAVAHGQMPKEDLEQVMEQFVGKAHDILVATTIIESGLDIPSVNTIIVNHAEDFGLSQLYQLRGRVGRSSAQAYCYLFYPKNRALPEVAEKRLAAIEEFTELGAGFKVAMRDLEIRGVGNILGPQQHGNVAAVGFDLYSHLLGEAVARHNAHCQNQVTLFDFMGPNALTRETLRDGSSPDYVDLVHFRPPAGLWLLRQMGL